MKCFGVPLQRYHSIPPPARRRSAILLCCLQFVLNYIYRSSQSMTNRWRRTFLYIMCQPCTSESFIYCRKQCTCVPRCIGFAPFSPPMRMYNRSHDVAIPTPIHFFLSSIAHCNVNAQRVCMYIGNEAVSTKKVNSFDFIPKSWFTSADTIITIAQPALWYGINGIKIQ
jgi:hypothetical protein